MSLWFVVPRTALLAAVQTVMPAVARGGALLPMLTHLHLRLEDGALTVTGTDAEIEIRATTPVERGEDGAVTVPAQKLQALVRALPENATVLARLDGDRLRLQSHRGRYQLATLPADQFPEAALDGDTFALRLPAAALRRLLETVVYAAARNDVRYYLNGVLLELAGGRLTAVASDGHWLAAAWAALPAGGERRAILPRRAVEILSRLLPDDGEVPLRLTDRAARIELDGVVVTTRLIEGRYPEWRRAVPETRQAELTLEAQDLADAVARVDVLAHADHHAMMLAWDDGRLRIQARNPDQEQAQEMVDAALDGDLTAPVGYNGRYLREALGRLDGQIRLRLLGDQRVAQLVAGDGEDGFHLIMPIRL
ncbi:MAG TPA: DNA polymerase III subunit beta [Gammaproteobacteria bacterium]|nr:DNA polymerase III subunit beta [Gammaproteobacteria bacterium]